MTLDFSVSSHCCTPDSFATDGAIRILCLHYIAFTLVCVVKYVCVLQGRTPIDVAPESMEPLLLRLQKQQESVSRIVLVLLSAAVSLPLL